MANKDSNEHREFDAEDFAKRAARTARPTYREALAGDKIAAKDAITALLLEFSSYAARPDFPISPAALIKLFLGQKKCLYPYRNQVKCSLYYLLFYSEIKYLLK